ncbi:MAG: hypothetical protein AAF430_03230 [Myxococcota bacterium]
MRAKDQLAEAVGTTAERVRHSSTVERLEGSLELRRVLKQAEDAQSHGDFPRAFLLLQAEVERSGDDSKLATAFWQAAVAHGQPQAAATTLLRAIRNLCSQGALEEAATWWADLSQVVPDARADAGSLLRMLPALEARDPALAKRALRHATDDKAVGLTPGLAMRAADAAHETYPQLALRAARVALAAPDLDESKRNRLVSLVAELERASRTPSAEAQTPEAPEPSGDETLQDETPAEDATEASAIPDLDEFTELVIDETLESPALKARFAGIKVMEAVPSGLEEQALAMRVAGDRSAHLPYEKIQAIASAEIVGDTPPGFLVVDLALNWHDEEATALRVVRLRLLESELSPLLEEGREDRPLRTFVARLLERSGAQALPDAESAQAEPLRVYDDLFSYEREVLRVGD